MFDWVVAAIALGLASRAESDAQKVVAGAMLSASISSILRKGCG